MLEECRGEWRGEEMEGDGDFVVRGGKMPCLSWG